MHFAVFDSAIFRPAKGRRSHQTNGEAEKKMKNGFAMNDTYSRCAAVHSFPPSPGRGTLNGVPVKPQQFSSSVFCSLPTGRPVGRVKTSALLTDGI